tara:strand:+ start:137 stop:310 length:174 start_codon:yes stop_codon:yes gene_type:complete
LSISLSGHFWCAGNLFDLAESSSQAEEKFRSYRGRDRGVDTNDVKEENIPDCVWICP